MQQYELIFDTDKCAVACVLLQAALGCDSNLVNKFGFDPNTWLVAPTKGMSRIRGTEEEWKKAAMIANEHWSDRRAS